MSSCFLKLITVMYSTYTAGSQSKCHITVVLMLSADAVIAYALVGQENDEDMGTNEYEMTYNHCA